MTLRRKEIRWGDYKVLVRQATYGDAIRRSAIIASVVNAMDGKEDEPGAGLTLVIAMDYAACVSATESAEGLDLEALRQNLEVFLNLPDEFVSKWKEAVYELNPHWDPKVIFASLSPPSVPS